MTREKSSAVAIESPSAALFASPARRDISRGWTRLHAREAHTHTYMSVCLSMCVCVEYIVDMTVIKIYVNTRPSSERNGSCHCALLVCINLTHLHRCHTPFPAVTCHVLPKLESAHVRHSLPCMTLPAAASAGPTRGGHAEASASLAEPVTGGGTVVEALSDQADEASFAMNTLSRRLLVSRLRAGGATAPRTAGCLFAKSTAGRGCNGFLLL